MSTHSLVDDILTALSHLSNPTLSPQPQPNARIQPQSYTTGQHSPSKASSPLSTLTPSASQDAKSLFLPLHFLFPHELLPALDLLDRGLITRLIPATITDTSNNASARTQEVDVFYVQSASAATSQHPFKLSTTTPGEPQGRFRDALASTNTGKGKGSATRTYYEVRLDSWNCSCAAFAFSAFTALTNIDQDRPHHDNEGEERMEADEADVADVSTRSFRFGGTVTLPNAAVGIPVCKHILAAVMAKAAPGLFVEGVHIDIRKEVGREEMAGWGAGWGD